MILPDDLHGICLLDLLARSWPELERAALRRAVKAGLVTVNGLPGGGPARLCAGDRIVIAFDPAKMPRHRRPTPDRLPDILHEGPGLLVVAKPSGMPAGADAAGGCQGVLSLLKGLRPQDDLRILHRLDRDASGLLAFSRDLAAARALDQAFSSGLVEERHLALVEGRVSTERFKVTRSLGPDPRRPGKVRAVADGSRGARQAWTDIEVVERFAEHTLLAVRPRTSRGHQIRVHLRHAGHGIVCDRDYGRHGELLLSDIKRRFKLRTGVREKPILQRMFLHASRLCMPDPRGGGSITVEAPLPEDLGLVLAKLRRFSPARGGRRCG